MDNDKEFQSTLRGPCTSPLKSYVEECTDAPFIYPSDGCTEGGCRSFCPRPLALAPACEPKPDCHGRSQTNPLRLPSPSPWEGGCRASVCSPLSFSKVRQIVQVVPFFFSWQTLPRFPTRVVDCFFSVANLEDTKRCYTTWTVTLAAQINALPRHNLVESKPKDSDISWRE